MCACVHRAARAHLGVGDDGGRGEDDPRPLDWRRQPVRAAAERLQLRGRERVAARGRRGRVRRRRARVGEQDRHGAAERVAKEEARERGELGALGERVPHEAGEVVCSREGGAHAARTAGE
jgi:hypothetical protein